MAETAKTKTVAVRNTAKGIRGLHLVDGFVELNPGELLEKAVITEGEFASAKSTGHFAFGKDAAAEGDDQAGAQDIDLDALDDETLAATVAAITGKAAPAGADRAALLALARGEPAAKA